MSEKAFQNLTVDFDGLRSNLAQSFNDLIKYLRASISEGDILDASSDKGEFDRLEDILSDLRMDIGWLLLLQQEGEFEALAQELHRLEQANIQEDIKEDWSE